MRETILIHGWGFCAESMQTILNLDNQKTVDLYALCKEYSFAESINIIANNITEPANIIAWSIGGLYAMQLAADYPEKINKLLLFTTTPCYRQNKDWTGITDEQLSDLKTLLQEKPQQALNRFAGWSASGNNTKRDLLLAKKMLTEKADKKALLKLLDALENIDLREELNNIKTNTKLLLANNDTIVAKENFSNSFKNNIEIETVNSSHMLPFLLTKEQQQELVSWLQD